MTAQFNENDIRTTVAFMNLLLELDRHLAINIVKDKVNKILEPLGWQILTADLVDTGEGYRVTDIYVVEYDNS